MIAVLQLLISSLLIAVMWAFIALGLNLIFGVMGIINLSHGPIILGAAYLSWAMSKYWGLNAYLSILINMPLFFVVGLVIYQVVVKNFVESEKLSNEEIENFSLVVTFALGILLQNVYMASIGPGFHGVPPAIPGTISIMGLYIPINRLLFAVIGIGGFIALYFFLYRTRLGKAVRAVSQNKNLASMAGIKISRINTLSFGLGTAMAALGGSLIPEIYMLIPAVGFEWTLLAFIIVIIGGLGSLEGAVLGALVFFGTKAIFTFYAPSIWAPLVGYLMLLAIVLIRPKGLMGK